MSRPLSFALVLLTTGSAAADPVVLEQVVSRHDPRFDVARARLAVGLDGNVYLASHGRPDGYALRVSPDGRVLGDGLRGVADLAAEGHFPHRVAFWGTDFAARGK